jgi:tRNA (guanine37-N1)-methyltransferase
MLIRVDVIDKAIKDLKNEKSRIILTSAKGKKFTQQDAQRLAKYDNLIFICGHYEGFDERISKLVDEEISIGDYVLTGGELPTMVMIDATARLLPGVLGKDESSVCESHSEKDYIEYPQYTRPQEYEKMAVPEVLLSGDPKKIKDWLEKSSRKNNNG